MPYRERRNLSHPLSCLHCQATFYPYKGEESTAKYCCRACGTVHGRQRMAALRAAGHDPAHGGLVAEKRRAALAQRRAAGGNFGRMPRRAPAPGAPAVRPPTPSQRATQGVAFSGLATDSPTHLATGSTGLGPTIEQRVERDSLAWLAAGNRYEGLAAKLLATEAAQRERRTFILTGYGAGLRVERDALLVSEGRTHSAQTPAIHTLYRGMHGVSRIVCLDPKGSISFPAVSWCTQQGITVLLLDRSGHLLSTLTPGARADAALRRSQYFAESTGRDIPIVQELLRRKLAAQRATLACRADLPGQVRGLDALDTALAWLTLPADQLPPWLCTLDGLRAYEGRAAWAYFASWVGWPLRWGKADTKRVPPHWLVARERWSPVPPGMARNAVDPVNAALNYAYALLEGRCRQALTRLGFDVACGFLHLDKLGRDSLVYDLMECERGTVDGLVLDFLGRTTLHYGDVTPLSDGSCRLHPQLARAVVASCRVDQQRLDEHAKWLRDALLAPFTEPLRPISPALDPGNRVRKRPPLPSRHARTGLGWTT